jgi:hypothetical protein
MILIVFVMVAFIGMPVFLSWKRNRGATPDDPT